MSIRPATLDHLVHDVAQQNGAKAAVIFADEPISYAELDERIERAANGLAAHGIGQGDRVALLLPNVPEFMVAYYAVMRRGAIVVPVNVLYKNEEIAYILRDSEAKAADRAFDVRHVWRACRRIGPSSVSLVVVVGAATRRRARPRGTRSRTAARRSETP